MINGKYVIKSLLPTQEDKNDNSQQKFDMCHVDSMMMVGFCLVFELAQKEFLKWTDEWR